MTSKRISLAGNYAVLYQYVYLLISFLRGIRIIGWHFQHLRFPETEDYFMLNRVLSLIAEFFEAHPNPHNFSSNSVVSTEILFPELAALEANLFPSSSSSSEASSSDEEEESSKAIRDETLEEKIPLDILAEAVSGDPELEKTIKLAMKLQRKEYERGTSSSSSSDSGSSSEVSLDFSLAFKHLCIYWAFVHVVHSRWS